MKRKALSLIAALTICLSGAFAQTEAFVPDNQNNTLNLSLEQAKQYAIKHNRNMQNATYAEKVAEAQKWQAFASMLPQVSLNYAYNNFLDHEIEFGMMKMAMPATGTFTAQASMTLSGAQIVGVQLANMSAKLSKVSTQSNNQDITSNVIQVYMSILMLEKTDTLLKENLKNIEALYNSTQEAVRVGVSEETDADQLKVQVASMKNTINSTERNINMLYNSLRLQLGAKVDTKITLTESIEDLLSADRAMALLGENFNINNNYNYQLLKAQDEIKEKQVTAAWWNYGPALTAFYQYHNQHTFGDGGFDMQPPHTIGIQASWNIFTSGSNYAKVKEAKLNYAQNRNSLETVKDQLEIQNQQLRYNLNSAYENYKNQEENLDVTRRVLESTTNKFKYGTASSIDVTTASSNMIAAQNNYVAAMTDLVNAQIELEKLLNTASSNTSLPQE